VPIAADAGFAGVGRYGRDPTRSSHGRQPAVKRVREVPRGAYARDCWKGKPLPAKPTNRPGKVESARRPSSHTTSVCATTFIRLSVDGNLSTLTRRDVVRLTVPLTPRALAQLKSLYTYERRT
jgi:hypothetical protein